MDLFRALPKAELHAHLHGSIRPSTLVVLVRDALGLQSNADAEDAIRTAWAVSFRVFGLIYQAVCTEAVVRRITAEVVEDWALDGVDYLELRTTPRALDGRGGGSDEDAAIERYILAVLETLAVIDARGSPAGITVRVLLSINRASSSDATADRLVRLAVKYARTAFTVSADGTVLATDSSTPQPDGEARFGPYVVGVDLGGDPRQGSATAFFPALDAARAAGLRVTVHAGEVMNVAEAEAVLDWDPDRLGHMCVLAPLTLARLAAPHAPLPRIPVETCPTGNSITLRLPSLRHHPTLPGWLAAGHPLAVSTDNGGVYGVKLSDELRSVAETFDLGPRAAADLALGAFRLAFLQPPEALARLIAAAEAKAERVLAEVAAQSPVRTGVTGSARE